MQAREYAPIEVPKNTSTGFVNAFFAVVTGFALIWHIWWMAALGVFGAFVTFLVFAFREQEEVEIPAETIAQFDRAHPTVVRKQEEVEVPAEAIAQFDRAHATEVAL